MRKNIKIKQICKIYEQFNSKKQLHCFFGKYSALRKYDSGLSWKDARDIALESTESEIKKLINGDFKDPNIFYREKLMDRKINDIGKIDPECLTF